MPEPAWGMIVKGHTADRKTRPRSTGLTMVIDTGTGPGLLADVLTMSGDYIDHWKLSFGTSVFLSKALLQSKLAQLAERQILSYPGGTLLEAALVEQHCRDYMKQAKSLGFTAVEISDGTIPMPAFRRRNIIHCACDAGLTPITEVGKKDPRQQPTAEQIAEQALQDLEHGARWVVVEARESGRGIGIFDTFGRVIEESVASISRIMGAATEQLIWEAPHKEQQTYLVRKFGCNVGLGNILPEQVLALEALRCGLRFDTLYAVADELVRTGVWNPNAVEPPVGNEIPIDFHDVKR
jgi:phosphosulfolactate synthase